jgi:opacity protein-like surface antigen
MRVSRQFVVKVLFVFLVACAASLDNAEAANPPGVLLHGRTCWKRVVVGDMYDLTFTKIETNLELLGEIQSEPSVKRAAGGRRLDDKQEIVRVFWIRDGKEVYDEWEKVPCPPQETRTAQVGMNPAWTGWVGLNAGFAVGTGNFREAAGTGDFSTSGGTFGGTLGFGARSGPYKFGAEFDLNAANFNGSSNVNCAVGCGVTNHWFGTGGLAFGNVSAEVNGFPGVSKTNVGWTAGGGVAFPLGTWQDHRIVGKFEYLHVDLGSVQCTPATCGGTADVRSTQEVVRVGINLAFQP